jgi:hypothetical protein
MPSALRVALGLILAVPLVFGLFRAVRLSRAENIARGDDLKSLISASLLEPSNAAYHARIVELEPARRQELDLALRLDARNPSWWMILASRQEQEGDAAAAEQSLLKANTVSQYYLPRWTIAYFYYRQRRVPEFSRWARAALSSGSGDTESIYRMARKLDLPPSEILKVIVPNDSDRVASYAEFLARDGSIDQLYGPLKMLVSLGAVSRRDSILENVANLFSNGQIPESVSLWNEMVGKGWLPFSQLDPQAGKVLSRDNFRGPIIQHGFDWRFPNTAGVSIASGQPDGGLRVEFSGSEPAEFPIAYQWIPLLPARKYRLAVRYHTQSIHHDSGLEWVVREHPSSKRLAVLPLTNRDGDDAEQSVTFEMPKSPAPAELVLSYARRLGTTKVEGVLWIQSVKLSQVR